MRALPLLLQDGSLYAITKGVEHSAAPHRPGVVRMEDCHRCVCVLFLFVFCVCASVRLCAFFVCVLCVCACVCVRACVCVLCVCVCLAMVLARLAGSSACLVALCATGLGQQLQLACSGCKAGCGAAFLEGHNPSLLH